MFTHRVGVNLRGPVEPLNVTPLNKVVDQRPHGAGVAGVDVLQALGGSVVGAGLGLHLERVSRC